MQEQDPSHAQSGKTELTSITDTIRSEGFQWLLRRLRYRTPHTAQGRSLHKICRQLVGAVLWPTRHLSRKYHADFMMNNNTLYAFYDLQVAPVTYDVSWFVASAELARRHAHLENIHFVIVPGNHDGFREERALYEAAVDTETRRWRLNNIVLPILTFVPSFAGYTILPSRQHVHQYRTGAGSHVYPELYEPHLPVSHHPSELLSINPGSPLAKEVGSLRSPAQGIRYVTRWLTSRLSGRKLITITLRDYSFMKARNSNIEAWIEFANRLDSTQFFPVFIVDTERTLDILPPELTAFEVFREASWNVWLRMSLYESSYLNLGINNGPLFMSALNNKTRLLIFKIVTPSVPQTTEELISKIGFTIGGQLPFASRFQKLVWKDDTLDILEYEFQKMVAHINSSSPADGPIHCL